MTSAVAFLCTRRFYTPPPLPRERDDNRGGRDPATFSAVKFVLFWTFLRTFRICLTQGHQSDFMKVPVQLQLPIGARGHGSCVLAQYIRYHFTTSCHGFVHPYRQGICIEQTRMSLMLRNNQVFFMTMSLNNIILQPEDGTSFCFPANFRCCFGNSYQRTCYR